MVYHNMAESRWSCSSRILPACFAWGLFLGLTVIFFIFPCHYIYYYVESGAAYTVYDAVLTLLVFAHFLSATFVDPGKYPKASEDERERADPRLALTREMEIDGVSFRMKWCTTCQFYRPPRCSHCSMCDLCIDTFDHHCPWVNNCIGRRNYRFFVLFLFSLWIHMVTVLVLSALAVVTYRRQRGSLSDVTPIMAIAECVLVSVLLIPVTGLSVFHTYLISSGRTTNEQVTGKIKADANPFSRGCFMNWCSLFFAPQLPRLLDRAPSKPIMHNVKLTRNAGEEPTSADEVSVLIGGRAGDGVPLMANHILEKKPVLEDNHSVSSSVILTELQIDSRRRVQSKLQTASTNNLIHADTAPSLQDYYIKAEPDDVCNGSSGHSAAEMAAGERVSLIINDQN